LCPLVNAFGRRHLARNAALSTNPVDVMGKRKPTCRELRDEFRAKGHQLWPVFRTLGYEGFDVSSSDIDHEDFSSVPG